MNDLLVNNLFIVKSKMILQETHSAQVGLNAKWELLLTRDHKLIEQC